MKIMPPAVWNPGVLPPEFNVPFFWLADQTLTLGMEWNHDQLDDPASMQATNSNGETILGPRATLRNAVPKTAPPSPVSIWKIISKPCPAPI
ncbi:hypothetical protein LNQ52_28125 [Klebsiella pneumoniae subsp. pneumoniae]|nr:hypothetical protein [Klebsiella pneumoniae subsp. pneumoniae]